MNNSIYKAGINQAFAGKYFSEVANILYHEFQVIFFAVATRIHDRKHLLVNPGRGYMLRSTDECFFISHTFSVVEQITEMVKHSFLNV
jgi:hypothetical protein